MKIVFGNVQALLSCASHCAIGRFAVFTTKKPAGLTYAGSAHRTSDDDDGRSCSESLRIKMHPDDFALGKSHPCDRKTLEFGQNYVSRATMVTAYREIVVMVREYFDKSAVRVIFPSNNLKLGIKIHSYQRKTERKFERISEDRKIVAQQIFGDR